MKKTSLPSPKDLMKGGLANPCCQPEVKALLDEYARLKEAGNQMDDYPTVLEKLQQAGIVITYWQMANHIRGRCIG